MNISFYKEYDKKILTYFYILCIIYINQKSIYYYEKSIFNSFRVVYL